MKRINILISVILIFLLLGSCGKAKENGGVSSVTSGETVKTDISTEEMDFEFTNNDLNYGYDEASAVEVGKNEDIVKITAEGTYIVTGRHTQILVSAPDTAKIKIVLKDAEITNSTGPAIYISAADKVFITALAGSDNTLSDGAEYSVISQGGLSGAGGGAGRYLTCSVKINNVEYAVQRIGLNFVIYDNEHSVVADSVEFNTYDGLGARRKEPSLQTAQ